MSRSTLVVGAALAAIALPAFAGFDVSSYNSHAPQGPNYHNAASALDSNLETAWMVEGEAKNEGSWISIDTPTATLDKLSVVIGWQNTDETFRDYARIKKAKVEMFSVVPGSAPELVGETTVSFEDKQGWQMVELPDTKVGGEFGGGRVKVTVAEVYPGADYPALAVSEVRVHLKEFEAANLGFRDIPSSETAGHDGMMMMDGSSRTFWAAEGPQATFSVEASGYGLSSLGITQGPKAYHRPKTVKLTANMAEVTHTLQDKPGQEQWVLLPALVGYTGGAWGEVKVEIVDTYEGAQPGVAITELKMMAGSIEEF